MILLFCQFASWNIWRNVFILNPGFQKEKKTFPTSAQQSSYIIEVSGSDPFLECKNLRRAFGTIRRLFGNVCMTSYINCVLCRPSRTGLPCTADIFIQICYQVPRELCSRGNPKQLEGFDFEVQVRKNCKETIRTKYHFTTIICEGSIANNITALMEFLVVYLW